MNQNTTAVSVIIADHHELFMDGLKLLFENDPFVEIMASASNGHDLIKQVETFLPQVVFTEIQLPSLNGINATRTIKNRFPGIKVIGLSGANKYYLINELIKAGADGYVVKNASKETIVKAIRTVLSGEQFYCSETLLSLAGRLQTKQQTVLDNIFFSGLQLQILKLIAQEKTSSEIAEKLGLSPRTIEAHRMTLQKKTGTNSAVGVVMYALKKGLIRLED